MHDKWLNNECMNTLELTDNSEEEIEEVEMFIRDEIFEDDVEPEESNLYKVASVLCLTVLIGSYVCKAVYIIQRVMN
jgi:hypothetical protein